MRISDWSSDVCFSDLRNTSSPDSRNRPPPRAGCGCFRLRGGRGGLGRSSSSVALGAQRGACAHCTCAIPSERLPGSACRRAASPLVYRRREPEPQSGYRLPARATPAGHSWAAWRVRVELSVPDPPDPEIGRSEEHTSELQSLLRSSYACFC